MDKNGTCICDKKRDIFNLLVRISRRMSRVKEAEGELLSYLNANGLEVGDTVFQLFCELEDGEDATEEMAERLL